jgi:hypothetical protein
VVVVAPPEVVVAAVAAPMYSVEAEVVYGSVVEQFVWRESNSLIK